MSSSSSENSSSSRSSVGGRVFSDHAEDANNYSPGGFHLVSLGDVYESTIARYKIMHKLGYGSYSTVWLASVLDKNGVPQRRYRALKFRQSDVSGLGIERALLRRIASSSSPHPGRGYVVRLYDDFEVCGPNGKHEVFVTEVTGPTLEMMSMCVYDAETGSLPETLCRRWAQQLLLALGYLSTEGIVHGDLHANNVAMAVTFLDGRSEDEVLHIFGDVTTCITRCYNPIMKRFLGLSVPERTVMPGSLVRSFVKDMRVLDDKLDLRLLDFGQAVRSNHVDAFSVHTPNTLRAPELQIFSKPSATNPFAVDVWAAGCLIYTMATGRELFEYTAGAFLKDIARAIGGPRPAFWPQKKWVKDEAYRGDDRLPQNGSAFAEFVRLLLAPDPDHRPTIPFDDLLQHEWISPRKLPIAQTTNAMPEAAPTKRDAVCHERVGGSRRCFCVIL